MVQLNHIVGAGIIILNIIPFLIKESRYVYLTAIISFITLFLFAQLG